MASESCPSKIGAQLTPPSVVFHTPPLAPPRYSVSATVGWAAMAVTRPEYGGGPANGTESGSLPCSGRGPMASQVGTDAAVAVDGNADEGPEAGESPEAVESPEPVEPVDAVGAAEARRPSDTGIRRAW